MLSSGQILHLLDRCEKKLGQPLLSLRQKLVQRDHWLAMVWELIVLDAALQIADVCYEPGNGKNGGADFRLKFYDDKWVWLEATFGMEKTEEEILKLTKHPVRNKLKSKERQAKKSGTNGPLVVCIGTDRVRQYGNMHGPREIKRDEAILSYLAHADHISAALIAPSFSKFEVFAGLRRSPQPMLIEHPQSKNPLPSQIKEYLVMLDFCRWPLSPMDSPLKSPVAALIPPKREGISLPQINNRLLPQEELAYDTPVYSYHWNFDHLRIVGWGKKYALFNKTDLITEACSPEECALVASELFCWVGRVLGPKGIEPHPDPGVPSDLSKWKVEVPD